MKKWDILPGDVKDWLKAIAYGIGLIAMMLLAVVLCLLAIYTFKHIDDPPVIINFSLQVHEALAKCAGVLSRTQQGLI